MSGSTVQSWSVLHFVYGRLLSVKMYLWVGGLQAANGSGKRGLGAGGEPPGSQRIFARSYWQLNSTKPKPGRHGARGAGWQNKCPALIVKEVDLRTSLHNAAHCHSGRARGALQVRAKPGALAVPAVQSRLELSCCVLPPRFAVCVAHMSASTTLWSRKCASRTPTRTCLGTTC